VQLRLDLRDAANDGGAVAGAAMITAAQFWTFGVLC
jgi:hypothetical protein